MCDENSLTSILFSKLQVYSIVLVALIYSHHAVNYISRTYSFCITETLYPLINISPFLWPTSPCWPPFCSLCLQIQLFCIPHLSEIICIYVWFISSSRFIHVFTNGRFVFSKLNNVYISLYIFINLCHILFIHLCID